MQKKVSGVARMGEICLLVLICQVLVCILQGTISRRFCYWFNKHKSQQINLQLTDKGVPCAYVRTKEIAWVVQGSGCKWASCLLKMYGE